MGGHLPRDRPVITQSIVNEEYGEILLHGENSYLMGAFLRGALMRWVSQQISLTKNNFPFPDSTSALKQSQRGKNETFQFNKCLFGFLNEFQQTEKGGKVEIWD